MSALGCKVVSFESHKIDQMREVLQQWSLDGWEVKATWTRQLDKGTQWQEFILQKPLEANQTTSTNKRQKLLPSFDKLNEEE